MGFAKPSYKLIITCVLTLILGIVFTILAVINGKKVKEENSKENFGASNKNKKKNKNTQEPKKSKAKIRRDAFIAIAVICYVIFLILLAAIFI